MGSAVLTVQQMRAAEQAAMEAGTSEWALMQRAGSGAAQWTARMAAGRPVTVLCGPGNNGGDGYVIAEELRRRGNPVHVIAPEGPRSDTAKTARESYRGECSQRADLAAPVLVDCLFGYGLSREVEGEYANLLDGLARAEAYKIAVDVPSSVESDTGAVLGPLPRYDLTLALGAWKRAHFLMPACAAMGVPRLVDIGIPIPGTGAALSQRPALSPPAPDAHKYRRGLLAILVGDMPGAPLLAAQAAMQAGAGYVKLASDHSHPDAPADLVIDAQGWRDDRVSALLVGPGLGRGDAARERLGAVLALGKPAVLDADALHLLGPDMLAKSDPALLLVTPHEGELAALCSAYGIEAQGKPERAQALHDATGLTVLAKGPDTLLCGAGGMRFFPRGSSWLSVAGSGDVLAGIAASRLAGHGDPARAAQDAVWIHSEAANLAAPAFTASQLADAVRPAMGRFL